MDGGWVCNLAEGAVISARQIAEIPNLLLAQSVPADQPIAIAPWADLLLVETTSRRYLPIKSAALNCRSSRFDDTQISITLSKPEPSVISCKAIWRPLATLLGMLCKD